MPEMLIFQIMTKFEMLAKQWEDSILTPDEALLIVGGNSDGGAANNCRCNGNNCSCGGRANNCRIFPICHGGCSTNSLELKDYCIHHFDEDEKDDVVKNRIVKNSTICAK